MKKYFSLSEYKDLNLYFESGRFLVGTWRISCKSY